MRACENTGTGPEPMYENLQATAANEVPVPILSFARRYIMRPKHWRSLAVLLLATIAGCSGKMGQDSNGEEGTPSDVERNLGSYKKHTVDIIVTRAGVGQPEMGRLDESIGARLQEVEGVQRVIAGLLESTSYPDRNLTMVLIQGWPADSPMFNDLKIARGERLQPADKGKQRVMVSARLAETLGSKTGGKIDVLGKQFTISGEFESFSVYENNSFILLLGDLQQLVGLPGKVTGFQIVATDSKNKQKDVKRLCARIKELRDDKGQLLGLEARPTNEFVKSAP